MRIKLFKVTMAAFTILSLLSACGATAATPQLETLEDVNNVATFAAQTIEAMTSSTPLTTAPPKATHTETATATLPVTTATEAFTPTDTETPLLTSTFTLTPRPTTKPLPFACNPDGVGISHIEISNFTSQGLTVYVSSENCCKTVDVPDGSVVTIAVPFAVYTVYGYIGTDKFFSVSGYVSDSIHTWFVRKTSASSNTRIPRRTFGGEL